jgi:diacylglycerol O-acyltransferase / wax synthase
VGTGRLPITDAGWLMAEDRERPMHVGGLQLFRLPADVPTSFVRDSVVAAARAHAEVRPPFDRRLHRPYGRVGSFRWVPEGNVDLDYHFRHVALPEPGRIRELLAFVSLMHSTLLDRHRPLWEVYLVEGLADRRVALYAKVHHSMLDGVAAMRQLLQAYATDPEVGDLPPPWAVREQPRAVVEQDAAGPFAMLPRLISSLVEEGTSLVGVGRAVTDQLVKAQLREAEVLPFQAPTTMLDARLTGARRYVAQSYALERFEKVAAAFDATINDVVLTVCGAALRAYLLRQDALPDKPLIAAVPVSIRPTDTDSGNELSMLLANLATHVEDPGERLAMVKASMDHGKERLKGMSRTELRDYGLLLMGPILLAQMAGIGGRHRPLYNLVISNVPGPTEPLYWNGARMDGLYPVALLPDGDALNITQTSYAGSMEFGITAARDRLPHIQRLIHDLEDALTELERLGA